ncbi:hypothetical protein KW868_00630 [Acinetobacter guillouiae]|uniref:Uncharacterized protein n=1 Tax=Acinetobacter guillouiae TaxID=106649 RepID=A0A8X8GF68_ACIGI|nr:hypothetical protein [Acinetobacter guillouiae]MCF0262980.1 hypothetical protein [Acinetobacter guillouiae]
MNFTIILLIGTIAILFGYIKYELWNIEFKFALRDIPDERKWYEKIRFIIPILLLPIFSLIYVYWDQYPNRLIEKDSKIESIKTQSSNTLIWPYEIPTAHSVATNVDEDTKTKLQEIGEKYGTYGDTYGSLNTLFTGFAFAGLIISIFIQLLELRQTRKELSGQKIALTDQEKQFKKQTEILKNQYDLTSFQHTEAIKQNFYHQFYALMEERRFRLQNLSVHKELMHDTTTMKFIFKNENCEIGIPAFQVYLKQIEQQLQGKLGVVKENRQTNQLFRLHLHHSFDSLRFSQISPVINLTDNLITTIKGINTNLTENQNIDLENYYNIVASTLYPNEGAIIFWYGIFNSGWKKLIEESGLLRYFSYGEAEELAPIFYDIKAFGGSEAWADIYKKFNSTNTQQ